MTRLASECKRVLEGMFAVQCLQAVSLLYISTHKLNKFSFEPQRVRIKLLHSAFELAHLGLEHVDLRELRLDVVRLGL